MRNDLSGAMPARSAAAFEQFVFPTVRSPSFGMAVMSCSRPAGPSGGEFSPPPYSALSLAPASPSTAPAIARVSPSPYARKRRRLQDRTCHVGDDRTVFFAVAAGGDPI